MDEIKEKEIMMPVTVLYEGCMDCDRLEILVDAEKLFADDILIGTKNTLRCTNVYQCKKVAEMIRKIKEKE